MESTTDASGSINSAHRLGTASAQIFTSTAFQSIGGRWRARSAASAASSPVSLPVSAPIVVS
jgi:hypothetical protein